ncbi:6368_t:CDS:1, partial [Acaulospora morrowiae]
TELSNLPENKVSEAHSAISSAINIITESQPCDPRSHPLIIETSYDSISLTNITTNSSIQKDN